MPGFKARYEAIRQRVSGHLWRKEIERCNADEAAWRLANPEFAKRADEGFERATENERRSDWRRRWLEACQTRPQSQKPKWSFGEDDSELYGNDLRRNLAPAPYPPAPNVPEYEQREADYNEVLANQTGRFIPEAAYQKTRKRREEMDSRTITIAKALECRGETFFWGEDWQNRCFVVAPYSGTVLPLPATRRVNFFPSHAAQQRAKMLRDIEHFTNCYGQEHSRLYTITRGRRVPIHPVTLREATRAFHRRLSKLAAHPTLKAFGIRMQWAATEFGTPEWDAEGAGMTLHIHAHCLVTEPRSMSRKRRGRLRRKLWRVFGVQWDDAGPIENVREFVKYPAPPEDLDRIVNEAGPGVLCDFYEAVKGLHISRPLGDLRRERAERKAKARRLVRLAIDHEGTILAEKADWNAGRRPLKDNSARLAYQKLVKKLAKTSQTLPPNAEPLDPEEMETLAPPALHEKAGPRLKNRIIARLAPAPYGGPILEPAVVVWGFDGNLDAIRGQPVVAAMMERHREAWERASAALALIRACARDAGAQAPAASQGSQRSDNCPGAPPGWQRELELACADDDPPGPN